MLSEAKNPKVSVLMPVYKTEEKYLREAISSILNQTYTNFELLLVNDCSKDNSVEIIKEYKDKRIKLINNEKNSGAAITRNNGIKNANSKWECLFISIYLCSNKEFAFLCARFGRRTFLFYLIFQEEK